MRLASGIILHEEIPQTVMTFLAIFLKYCTKSSAGVRGGADRVKYVVLPTDISKWSNSLISLGKVVVCSGK